MASLNFNATVISEPELEFGAGGRHVDPRFGLVEHGPLQPMLGDTVRIGVIGTGDTAEGFAQFIERCRVGIDGKNQKLANLYPPFPGVGNQNPFRCTFEVDQTARRIVPEKDVRRIIEMRKQSEAVTTAAESPFYLSIRNHGLAAVCKLIRDPGPKVRDARCNSPLMYAASLCSLEAPARP